MSYFYITRSYDDLEHHGILGQKWGVRRFQNYDGTYTKKGLERYNKTKAKYDEVNKEIKDRKAKIKALKAEGKEAYREQDTVKTLKAKKSLIKSQLNADKAQLKMDYKADKGKELKAKGQTIEENNKKVSAVATGAAIANVALRSFPPIGDRTSDFYGKVKIGQKEVNYTIRNITVNKLLATGVNAAAAAYTIKKMNDNKKLRGYYYHKNTKATDVVYSK